MILARLGKVLDVVNVPTGRVMIDIDGDWAPAGQKPDGPSSKARTGVGQDSSGQQHGVCGDMM